MDLETARQHIRQAVDRMRACYLQPVFDEWAILGLAAAGGGVLAYSGPRPEAFKRNLPSDAEPLRTLTAGRQLADGDLEFAAEAAGTRYDALLKLGGATYLVFNHTGKDLAGIRADAKWLAVQAVLFELSEKFRADPLVVEQ